MDSNINENKQLQKDIMNNIEEIEDTHALQFLLSIICEFRDYYGK